MSENIATTPLDWYAGFKLRSDFEIDADQLAVLNQFERLHNELEIYRQYRQGKINRLVTNLGKGKRPPRGLYIWGSVGRGKSLMMDAFFSVSTLRRKRRVHFHEFMREVHIEMQKRTGTEDPLEPIADDIAKKLRLLCFDEFHVSDIADAMILGRLLDLLIDRGVVMVMTSNYPPDDLYPNGLQRTRFLPAIEIIKADMDVIAMAGIIDHRKRILESLSVYHVPANEASNAAQIKAFEAMAKTGVNNPGLISVGNRELMCLRHSEDVVWFEFDELCVKPRSQLDYLELANHFYTVLISNIPQLHARDRADVVRRFTWLIDVFYDKRIKLICSAAAEPEWLVVDDRITETSAASIGTNSDTTLMVSAEFARTASRLREMRSKEYFNA